MDRSTVNTDFTKEIVARNFAVNILWIFAKCSFFLPDWIIMESK